MATCPKCGCDAQMTEHHIYPQRFYGKDRDGNRDKVILCDRCHDKLEREIPVYPKQEDSFYLETAKNFLGSAFDDAFKYGY